MTTTAGARCTLCVVIILTYGFIIYVIYINLILSLCQTFSKHSGPAVY